MKQLATLGSTGSHDGNESLITIKGHWWRISLVDGKRYTEKTYAPKAVRPNKPKSP